MPCTNDRQTCTRFDCPLKTDKHPATNCSSYLVAHSEEIEDAYRRWEVERAKRLKSNN